MKNQVCFIVSNFSNKVLKRNGIFYLAVLISFVAVFLFNCPTSVYAARDTTVTYYSLEGSDIKPFSFRYGGSGAINMCLNQLTASVPVSGTNLTGKPVPSGGINGTQEYRMVQIISGNTIGHGYVCWNNQQVAINRRPNNMYVNVVTVSSAIMGNVDVRWGCDKDLVSGVSHYIACSYLDLSGFNAIGEYAEYHSQAGGTYLKWIAGLPSTPFEWIRYNEYTLTESLSCGCYYSTYGGWYYIPT